MLTLKNIKKTKTTMEADYYDLEDNKGYMKISIPDGEIIEHKKISEIAYGSNHVQRDLIRLSVLDNMPEIRVIRWY